MSTILKIVKDGLDQGLSDAAILEEVCKQMPLNTTGISYIRRIRKIVGVRPKRSLVPGAYRPKEWDEIERLFDTIKDDPIPAAVVDYLGRLEQDDDGILVQVQHNNPRRFGIRDMRNVEIYQLTIIKKNDACHDNI